MRTVCKRKRADIARERPSKVIQIVLSEEAESDISSPVIACELRCIEIPERRKHQGTLHYRALLMTKGRNSLGELVGN